MRRNNGGLPRELRSELLYAVAAANAWLRGLPLPCVALHYRYEPLTALNLIARLCRQYGTVHVEPFVPMPILSVAADPERWRCSALAIHSAALRCAFPSI